MNPQKPDEPNPPRRPQFRPWLWSGGAVAAGVIAIGVFLAQPDWDWARPSLTALLVQNLHRPVRIDGHLKVQLFSLTPSASISGLKIGEAPGGPNIDLADIGALSVSAELPPLFLGRLVLASLRVDQPNLYLFQDKTGHANWTFDNGKSAGKPLKLPPIKRFVVNDGRLSLTSLQRHLRFTGTVTAQETAAAGQTAANAQAFALTGDGQLNGKAFQLHAGGGPLLNVRTGSPYPFDAVVKAGKSQITAHGQVVHPFNLGELEGTVSVSGPNLADLYYLTGLSLPQTPRYAISAKLSRQNGLYHVDAINGRIGGSDIEGALTIDARDHGRPNVVGDLRSRVLRFSDLGSLVGATRANRPHAPQLSLNPGLAVSHRRVLPNARLDAERLRGMDARIRYQALSVQTTANLPLKQVRIGLTLDHGVMVFDTLELSFPQGRLQGTAKIDARTAVQHNSVDLQLTGLHVENFFKQTGGGAPLEGVIDARLQASGTGDSIHKAAANADGRLSLVMPAGRMRQSLAELIGVDVSKAGLLLLTGDKHDVQIRCSLADFSLQGGLLRAQNIVFDTQVVRVSGAGTINLADESLKLAFKGKPKQFRLFRLDVPLLIGGHLAEPRIGVDAGPAALQGGLALAFNSIIPLFSFNYAKNAACPSLMSDARRQGTPTTLHAAPQKQISAPTGSHNLADTPPLTRSTEPGR